ncbi:taste receptor type 2 member 1 [Cynocephalus volans]|uniref:taste receptor type 2 member 1 n=1 Tax=Cynocephalus volans TaxID=110931 RepID=UPI002FC6DDF6
MLQLQLIIHLILAVIHCLLGIFANGIIVVANGIDFIKHRKMGALDLLLSCLAISRIFMQLAIFYINLAALHLIKFSALPKHVSIHWFVNESALWFATWLSVFYCAKIATIPHPLFFWLKVRISKLVPWLILASLLYSSLLLASYSKYVQYIPQNLMVSFFFKNATSQIENHLALQVFFFAIGLILPLLIFVTAALLLIFSLGRHTRQMRKTAAGITDSSRRAHISAMLSTLSFLILYVTHYAATVLVSSQAFQFRSFIFQLCILMIGVYPSAHSIILILGNPRLKKNAKKFLLCSKCC